MTEFDEAARPGKFRRFLRLVALVFFLILVALPFSMLLVHRIDADLEFSAPEGAKGESRAVAIAARLIEREVETHRWAANDPFFLPGHWLDNMPNYQQGMIAAISRFAIEMADQIGRTRGSSEVDQDLEKAAGLLKYPGNIWIFDPKTSLAPTASSEKQYIAAKKSLLAYNARLAAGSAVFDRRADNLIVTLDRISKDLGSASAIIDRHIAEKGGVWLDTHADDIFYATRGRLYGFALLLRELGNDFKPVLAERQADTAWNQMLESLYEASRLDPLVVINAKPDALMRPSHLAGLGFYLLRARTQLQEVTGILTK